MFSKFMPNATSYLLGIVIIAFAGSSFSQDASFLDENANAEDGSISSENGIASSYKSTAEAILTYQLIGLGNAEQVARGREYLASPSVESSTENVSLWIAAHAKYSPVGDAVANLLKRQNADGGFSYFEDYSSEVLSTGFALHALATSGYEGAKVAKAIGYLLDSQRDDGSWALVDGSEVGSIELTAIVAKSIWEYRKIYELNNSIDAAISYLEENRQPSLWNSTEASALALNAILNRLIDRTDFEETVLDFTNLQQNDLSFDHDVYTTALGLRVLHGMSEPAPDDIVVSGIIVDSEFGTSIENAIVELVGPASTLSSSDTNGVFELNGVQPGYYDIRVTKNGFNTLSFNTSLQVGARLSLGEIELTRALLDPDTGEPLDVGSVRGTISNRQSGAPIAGAIISLRDTEIIAISGEDGSYSLLNIPAATYSIDVTAPGYSTVSGSAALESQQTLVFSPSLSEVVNPGVVVKGTIRARETNNPLQGVVISISSGAENYSAVTGASGNYEIEAVAAGLILITAALDGYHEVSGTGDFTDGAEIEFSPLLDELDSEQQNTLAGIKGVVVDQTTGVGLENVSITLAYDDSTVILEDFTGGDGEFSLGEAEAGSAIITFELGGYVANSGVLNVQSGLLMDVGLVELVPVDSAPSADVTGRVIDVRTSLPVPGVVVTAVPASGASVESITDDAGRFILPRIPAVYYELVFEKTGYVGTTIAIDTEAGDKLDIGDLRIREPGIEAMLADLSLVSIEADNLIYDQDSLSVAGEINGTLINVGNTPLESVIQIRAFEDRDFDGVFSSSDQILGETEFGESLLPISVDSQAQFSLEVEGTLSFYQAPIIVQLDSGELIAELSEANNYFNTAKICSGQGGVVIDLALCMDGSGSINSTNFTLQKEGTANAIEDEDVIPRDGSVRISAYQFAGSSTRVEIAPTIIEADNAELVADAVRTIAQRRSGTPMASCLNTASNTVLTAEPPSLLQAIDISTDGAPNSQSATRTAATNAENAGIDVVNAIGVGSGANISFLESIVFPQPAGGERGFVVGVNNFTDYVEAVRAKIQREVQTVDLTVGKFRLVDNGFDNAMTASMVIGNAGTGNITEAINITIYSDDPENGGQEIIAVEYTEGLNSGGFSTVIVDGIEPSSVVSDRLTVVVELATGFSECDQSNNRQTIPVLSTVGSIALTLSGISFGPQSELNIASTIVNTGAVAGNYLVGISIYDAEGTIVHSFPVSEITNLDPEASVNVDEEWNTGLTVAGAYTVEASLFDLENVILDTTHVPFTISDLDGLASAIVRATTDRPIYNVNDEVQLGIVTQNISQITHLENLTLEVRVSDPVSEDIYSESISISSLSQGQLLEYDRRMMLTLAAEGIYTYHLILNNEEGLVLASSSSQFEVVNDLVAAITGIASVQEVNIEQNEIQLCSYLIANIGVSYLENISLSSKLVNVSDESVLSDTLFTLSLESEEQTIREEEYFTNNLIPGRYACVLEARIDGGLKVLSSAQFNVLERPIDFVSQVLSPVDPNVLVLVDGMDGSEPGGEIEDQSLGKQAVALTEMLTELKDRYVFTSDTTSFSNALNTGKYNQILLLSENIELDSDTKLELDQSVLAGNGLISSIQQLDDGAMLTATFGAFTSAYSPNSSGITFQSDRYLGVDPHIAFLVDDEVKSFHLQGAVVDAGFELNSSSDWEYQSGLSCVVSDTAPAILYNKYVSGRSVLAGFDWALHAATKAEWVESLKRAVLSTRSSSEDLYAGESISLEITVTSSTGGSGRVLITPPANAQIVTGSDWTLTEGGQWEKSFSLAENESFSDEVQVAISTEGSTDWLFEVQEGDVGSYVSFEQISKTINVYAKPYISQIITLSNQLREENPKDAWLALGHMELAGSKELINAGDYLGAKNKLEKAINWMAQSNSEIDELRVAVARRYLELIRKDIQQ